MFGIDSGEILVIAVVALVVIGPKDLPRVMRTIGQFVGRARGMARHFRSGLDAMIREAELEDMEKKWKADNERIMREHPYPPASTPEFTADTDWGKSAPVADPPPQRALPGAPPPIPPSGAAPSLPSAGLAPPPGEQP